MNEQRASGRKASRPKDMKRLLLEKKAAGKTDDHATAGARVRWVDKSSEQPPVRAVVAVTHEGRDVDVNVTDATTAAHVLQVGEMVDRGFKKISDDDEDEMRKRKKGLNIARRKSGKSMKENRRTNIPLLGFALSLSLFHSFLSPNRRNCLSRSLASCGCTSKAAKSTSPLCSSSTPRSALMRAAAPALRKIPSS